MRRTEAVIRQIKFIFIQRWTTQWIIAIAAMCALCVRAVPSRLFEIMPRHLSHLLTERCITLTQVSHTQIKVLSSFNRATSEAITFLRDRIRHTVW